MSGIVILTLQLGVAIGGFVGMTNLIGWYNEGAKMKNKKEDKRNDTRNSMPRIDK